MRTILFKGKDKETNEWRHGGYFKTESAIGVISHIVEDGKIYIVDPSTVCQYTGQADKNETMVFEHDRVKHPIRGIGVIKWDDLLSCYYIAFEDRVSRFSLEKISEYEIIGNIHDKK